MTDKTKGWINLAVGGVGVAVAIGAVIAALI